MNTSTPNERKQPVKVLDGVAYTLPVESGAPISLKKAALAELKLAHCAVNNVEGRGPETLKFARRVLLLKSKDLALALGVDANTLSRWENEKRAVPGPVWLALSLLIQHVELTGVPAPRILEGMRSTLAHPDVSISPEAARSDATTKPAPAG